MPFFSSRFSSYTKYPRLWVVINHEHFISAFIADTMWLVAVCYYVYITFVGYSALPFLNRTVF